MPLKWGWGGWMEGNLEHYIIIYGFPWQPNNWVISMPRIFGTWSRFILEEIDAYPLLWDYPDVLYLGRNYPDVLYLGINWCLSLLWGYPGIYLGKFWCLFFLWVFMGLPWHWKWMRRSINKQSFYCCCTHPISNKIKFG